MNHRIGWFLAMAGCLAPGGQDSTDAVWTPPPVPCVRPITEACTDCPTLEAAFEEQVAAQPPWSSVATFECGDDYALRYIGVLNHGAIDYFDDDGDFLARELLSETVCSYGPVPSCLRGCYLEDLSACDGDPSDLSCLDFFESCPDAGG